MMIQRAEKTGKERGKRRQVNRTLRDPVKKVKTLTNIKENERGLVEPLTMSKVYQIDGKNIIKRRDNPQRKKIQRHVQKKTEGNRMNQRNALKGQKHEEKRKQERNITRKEVVTVTARIYNHNDSKHTKGLKRKRNRNGGKKRKRQEKRKNLNGLRKNTEERSSHFK